MVEKKSNRIIFVPYADKVGEQTAFNLKNVSNRKATYLMNCCVALASAKHFNPDCDVALVTNAEIPSEFQSVLDHFEIMVIQTPFDHFTFDESAAWVFDFFKPCSLLAVSKMGYDAYCYLDSDVYVQGSLSYVWEECRDNILMYDIDHGTQVAHYRHVLSEFASLLGDNPPYLTQYGGEFFAANHERVQLFLQESQNVYEEMLSKNVVTIHGNEFLASVVAGRMRDQVKNAGAYIYRFWTSGFRLVSTCYKYNPVSVLHVPAEKEDGMITLYRRYISKGKIPDNKVVWRLLHLTHRSPIVCCKMLAHWILDPFLKKKA